MIIDSNKIFSEAIAYALNRTQRLQILKDRKGAEEKMAICTIKKEDECFTHSAFIFDAKNKKAYYCQGNPLENDFIEYSF